MSPNYNQFMVTLDDGTVFTQSTFGFDNEGGKIKIRPHILEHLNCTSKMFSIGKHKPVIAFIENNSYEESEDNMSNNKE